jgi:hypothetical protein
VRGRFAVVGRGGSDLGVRSWGGVGAGGVLVG